MLSEEDVSALEDVGFAPELRFVGSLPLETLSLLPLEMLPLLPPDAPPTLSALLEETVSIFSALLEYVTSSFSTLLPLSPQAANMAATLNVAKSEIFFIDSPFFPKDKKFFCII